MSIAQPVDLIITFDVIDGRFAGVVIRLKARGQAVLVAGMKAPPNLGDDYAAEFNAIYPELAAAEEVLLYPFFLDGVAADPALNLADGIHPTREGVARIVEKILPMVEALIAKAGAKVD